MLVEILAINVNSSFACVLWSLLTPSKNVWDFRFACYLWSTWMPLVMWSKNARRNSASVMKYNFTKPASHRVYVCWFFQIFFKLNFSPKRFWTTAFSIACDEFVRHDGNHHARGSFDSMHLRYWSGIMPHLGGISRKIIKAFFTLLLIICYWNLL